MLDKYEEELTARLGLFQGQAQRRENSPHRTPREAYLWRRIADNFIQTCQNELLWTRQTRQVISEGNYQD